MNRSVLRWQSHKSILSNMHKYNRLMPLRYLFAIHKSETKPYKQSICYCKIQAHKNTTIMTHSMQLPNFTRLHLWDN